MIPARFKLASRTWRVKRHVRMKALGDSNGQRCKIRLSRKNEPGEEELHTFCHELAHAMYFTLGWPTANDNEAKVDALGNVLAQFLSTVEFDEEDDAVSP